MSANSMGSIITKGAKFLIPVVVCLFHEANVWSYVAQEYYSDQLDYNQTLT